MESLPGDKGISIRFLIIAPLVSLLLPFLAALIDRESQCCLIPLIEYGSVAVQMSAVVYFGLPSTAGIYGLKQFIENRKSRSVRGRKFYSLIALTALNLLSPILLYYWFFASVIALFGFGCYEFKIKM